jgi:long-chain acyl-CoA synthetase
MPEQDALDWDSNRSSNFLINNRLQTIVSNPLLLKSRHMKVHYAAVVGLPDARKGEVPVAAVALRTGEAATPEEIRGFCRDHIASYKIPVHVVFLRLNEFPRTSTGKVHKLALCEVIAARLRASATPLRHGEGAGGADPGQEE